MTPRRGLALFATIAAAGTLASAASLGPTATPARLKAISARVSAKGASLVVEATDPVAYVATRPDPLTVLLDFRNVASDGVANTVARNEKSPIANVSVEPVELLGLPAARVRIRLAQPVAHHVRSDRNSVVVDFEKPSATGTPFVLPVTVGDRQSPDRPIADPIAALGLDASTSQPSAPATRTATASTAIIGPTVRAVPASQAPAAVQPAQPPPTPSTQPAPQPFGITTEQRRFTGHPVSLDFQGADLRAVLRTFAEISGLNIVIDPTVQGSVDVALRDVPWDQALDIILRANKLGFIIDGTIVRIAPLTVLADEESQRRKLAEEQALSGQLGVLTKTLSYARAEDLQALLTKSALSARGNVTVDPRTNTLIITDLPDRLQTANDLIGTLDRAQPQVEIEARIIQTNRNFARALGVQWGFNGRVDPALGNTTNLAFPNNGALGGRVGTTPAGGTGAGTSQGPLPGSSSNGAVPTAVNLGVVGPNAVGLALGSINGAFNLDVALSALETSGNGKLLSTPRVTTQNNIAAEMTQGVQIPIQTVANNTVTVNFKDAALTLKVTPQITAANTVIMQITLENSTPDFSRQVQNNAPPINTQRAITTVLVNDGQTTVIGGIYTSQENSTVDKTPGLGSIPLIKWLFRRESVNDQNTELLVFITPRIIKS
jgi:type IV pilus assembly protein PilQ